MSSFNESVALGCLKQAPIEFVKYPFATAGCLSSRESQDVQLFRLWLHCTEKNVVNIGMMVRH